MILILSSSQVDFCAEIVSQYDYYVAYYYHDYYEYQTGELRDYKILLYCSDTLPTVSDGVYTFADCVVYEVTENKYISSAPMVSGTFAPIGSGDIVYTNISPGCPQLCKIGSQIEQFDFWYYASFFLVSFVCILVLIRVLFGGRS